MERKIFILLTICFVKQLTSQELLYDDGLYYEKPITYDTSQNRYSLDNISYKKNMVFTYDYYYLDKSGTKKKFLMKEDILKNDLNSENPMNLTDYENPSDSAIDKIKIIVTDWLNIYCAHDTNCTQTVFSYDYLYKNGSPKDYLSWFDGTSGVIDNRKNLWMHPPREYSFKILELNPFPFYYLDESVKRWTWTLDVGGFWLDPRWIDHKETITIKYEYIKSVDESLTTSFGNLMCKVTNATGKADLGNKLMETHLKSYYSPEFGFVRLEYTNIDKTKIIIQLIDLKMKR